MDNWKEKIMEAFIKGKTIQSNHFSPIWHDWVPQNQVDRPNLDYGNKDNWRVKPGQDSEREEILRKSGSYDETPMMKEDRKFSKEEMLLFGGFCVAKHQIVPNISGAELWETWINSFK